jgi:hypothetical protein
VTSPADYDFEAQAALVSAGNAKAVLLSVTPSTAAITYTPGSEFSYDPALDNPTHESAFAANYPNTFTPPAVPVCYVRIYPTQLAITQNDIFPAQLSASGGGGSSGGVDILVYVGL